MFINNGLPVKPKRGSMPEFFIKIGENDYDYVFNIGAFDFHLQAKEQMHWLCGDEDLVVKQIPKITSPECNFDIFSSKILRLLQTYSQELKKFYPTGMNSLFKTMFTAGIVTKFPLEVKYQEFKYQQRLGQFIGLKAKKDSLKWQSVAVSFL